MLSLIAHKKNYLFGDIECPSNIEQENKKKREYYSFEIEMDSIEKKKQMVVFAAFICKSYKTGC